MVGDFTLQALAAPVQQRLVLWLNHLIASEPQATQRLQPFAGKRFRLELRQWPAALPQPPALLCAITPAGLLEWVAADAASDSAGVDLQLGMRADAPLQLAASVLTGQRPGFDVQGDAALAAELDWLVKHLRWDVGDDLQRLFGAAPAQVLAQAAERGLETLKSLASRFPLPRP